MAVMLAIGEGNGNRPDRLCSQVVAGGEFTTARTNKHEKLANAKKSHYLIANYLHLQYCHEI